MDYAGPYGSSNPHAGGFSPHSGGQNRGRYTLTDVQRRNLIEQVAASAGRFVPVSRNPQAPCTIEAIIMDGANVTPQQVAEAMRPRQAFDLRFEARQHENQLIFDVSIDDAVSLLTIPRPACIFHLLAYAPPRHAPNPLILDKEQFFILQQKISNSEPDVMDLRLFPLQEPTMPWSFADYNYMHSLASVIASPSFINITKLSLQHSCLHDLKALSPLAQSLFVLDVRYNLLATVEAFNTISEYSKLKEIYADQNPFAKVQDYYIQLRNLNYRLAVVDSYHAQPAAMFPIPTVQQMQEVYSNMPDNLIQFFSDFFRCFDERQSNPGILNSAYQHDAAFSCTYMVRGSSPSFAPIYLKRNVSALLYALPPTKHELESGIIFLDSQQIGELYLVNFQVECLWKDQPVRYFRTFILRDQAQEPWLYTITNDQLVLQLNSTQFSYIFSGFQAIAGSSNKSNLGDSMKANQPHDNQGKKKNKYRQNQQPFQNWSQSHPNINNPNQRHQGSQGGNNPNRQQQHQQHNPNKKFQQNNPQNRNRQGPFQGNSQGNGMTGPARHNKQFQRQRNQQQ